MDINERLRQLHEKRNRAFGELMALVDKADDEKREMSGEERQSFERISDDLDAQDKVIETLMSTSERGAAFQGITEALGLNKPVEKGTPTVDEQLRAVARGEYREFGVDLPVLNGRLSPEVRATLVSNSDSAGILTQTEFVAQFMSALVERSSLLSLGPRIVTTTHGNTMEWPRQLTHMAVAARVEENAQIPKLADPTFDRVTLVARKYAGIAQISHEMIEDGIVDLSGLLVEELAAAVAEAFNADLYTGDGSNKPYGLLTRVSVGVTGGSAAAPTFDNLIDLEHSIATKYRANAKFIMNDTTVRTLRKVKDTTNNYIWQPGTIPGAPASILGKSYVTDEHVPSVGASTHSVLLGDPSAYWVRQVRNVRIERSDEYAFDTDLVSWKAVFRGGGDLMDLNAFKAYASAA